MPLQAAFLLKEAVSVPSLYTMLHYPKAILLFPLCFAGFL